MRVKMDDGTIIENVPENITKTELMRRLGKRGQDTGLMGSAAREVGLAGRAVIHGLTSIPGMIMDVPSHLTNAMRGAAEDFQTTPQEEVSQELGRGYRAPNAPLPSQLAGDTINKGLAAMGVPTPETPGERIRSDIYSALAGTKQMMGGSAPDSILRSSPGAQYASALLGAGSAGGAREMGAGTGTQLAAGLVGGIVPSVGLQAAGTALKGVGRFGQLFTERGQEKAVGRKLNSLAINPQKVQENLSNAHELVPGSAPTTGEVSGDYGIIAAQRGLKSMYPAQFAERYSEQNNARNILLDSIAKDKATLEGAIKNRDEVTSELRNEAFKNANDVVLSDVTNHIDKMAANPDNAGETAQKTLAWVKDLMKGKSDPRALYTVRKDIGHAMEGKLSGDRADFKLAKKQLIEVKNVIDSSIEKAAPGFGDYLEQYRNLSKPINQMEEGQEIQRRVMLSAPDINTGRDFISQPKWSNVVQGNEKELKKVMSAEQMRKLQAITADLDRGSSINNPAIRALGSDTLQNLTTAHVLGGVLSNNTITKSLGRSLTWLLKVPEEKVRQLLVDAMLDPAVARGLMSKATPQNIAPLGTELKRRAIAMGLGSFIGTENAK